MKKTKKVLLLLFVLALAISLVACGQKVAPKEALKKSMDLNYQVKSATAKTVAQINYTIPTEISNVMSQTNAVPVPLEAFNGSKFTFDVKSNLDQKRLEAKVAASVMGMALNADVYMNDQLLAFSAAPFLPGYVRMTNEDFQAAIAQNGTPAGMTVNFFEMIFNQDSDFVKKNKEMGLKLGHFFIDSLKDEYLKDNGDVDFKGELINGKFREISVDLTLEKAFDIIYTTMDSLEKNDEMINLLLEQTKESAKLNPAQENPMATMTVEEFKQNLADAKAELQKNRDSFLKDAKFVSLDGSKLAFGLDKDNYLRYTKFILKIDANLNELPEGNKLPMTVSENLKLDVTFTSEVDAINKTDVAEQQFDDTNSQPISSLNNM